MIYIVIIRIHFHDDYYGYNTFEFKEEDKALEFSQRVSLKQGFEAFMKPVAL
jgi:hypothetical protein